MSDDDIQNQNKKHKTLLIILVVIVLACLIVGGLLINSNINYNNGLKAIESGNFIEAVSYLEKSNTNKADEMIEALQNYEYGKSYYNNKEYIQAYAKLSLIEQSYPLYEEVQTLANKAKDIIVKKNLQQAKDNYVQWKFVEAYNNLKTVLQYEPNQKEALQLKDIYYKKSSEMENRLAEEEARKIEIAKTKAAEEKRIADEKAAELERQKYEPQKIVDSGGKQIWKIYISDGDLHFTGTYNGTGNFIVKLSDSNQDLVEVIANEIGNFVSDKTVHVPYEGWYYLEIYGSEGTWTYKWS